MVCLLAAVQVYFPLAGSCSGRPGCAGWAYAVITVALALYSHLFAAFVLLAEDVVFLGLALTGGLFKSVGPWILSQVALAAAYVPWLAIDSAALQSYGDDMVRAASLPAMAASLVATFVSGLGSTASLREVGLMLALVAAGLVLWKLLPSDEPPEGARPRKSETRALQARPEGALGLPWRGYTSPVSVLVLGCWLRSCRSWRCMASRSGGRSSSSATW